MNTRSKRIIPGRTSVLAARIVVVAAIILCLSAAALGLVKFIAKAPQIIKTRLSTALERGISLKRISFSPPLTLSIHGLEIMEKNNAGTFLTSARIDIKPGWKIFTGRLAIREIQFISPRFHFFRTVKGGFNFDPAKLIDRFNLPFHTASSMPLHPLRWPVIINDTGLICTDGHVRFEDDAEEIPQVDGAVDLWMKFNQSGSERTLREAIVKFKQTGIYYQGQSLSASGSIYYLPGRVNHDLTIKIAETAPINVIGSFSHLDANLTGSLKINSNAFPVDTLSGLPIANFPGDHHYKISGSFNFTSPTYKKNQLKALTGNFDLYPETLNITPFEISFSPNGRIKGTADIRFEPSPGQLSPTYTGRAILKATNTSHPQSLLWKRIENISVPNDLFAGTPLEAAVNFVSTPLRDLTVNKADISAGPLALSLTGIFSPSTGSIKMSGDYSFPQTLVPFQKRNNPPREWRKKGAGFIVPLSVTGTVDSPLVRNLDRKHNLTAKPDSVSKKIIYPAGKKISH